MHGFGISISFSNDFIINDFQWKKPFNFQTGFEKRKLQLKNFYAEQYTSKKFIHEKIWLHNEKYFMVTEGIITNIDELLLKYSTPTIKSLIDVLFEKKQFFQEFRGNFCGFLYNKRNESFVAFNNHTGTKKVFFFRNKKIALVCTDLFTLTNVLKRLNINYSPDIASAYLLLSSGFMIGNKTLVAEIQQISAGEYIEIKQTNVSLNSYFQISEIKETSDSKAEMISRIDFLFKQAIKREFEIDKKDRLISISTLSGGLDSRMTALTAHKMGYTQVLFNFSEKGYADQLIAQDIAKAFNLKLIYSALVGTSLTNIDENIAVNDGLTIYTGTSHVFSAIKNMNIENSGIIHTGILGDAIFGSYLKSVKPTKPDIYDGNYSTLLIHRASKLKTEIASKYLTEELYKFNTRGFYGINNGFLFFDLAGESLSPFLDADFLQYVLSIPRKYRYKEKIYIEWIRNYYPDISNFVWENIAGKPTNNEILRAYYRTKRAIIKRLPINTMWKNNMNPEQIWYDRQPEVKKVLDQYFKENLQLTEFNKELQNDVIKLYKTGKINEKTQVLTLLSAYKLLFSN